MLTVLIVCEKPSAAKNFAKALGGMSGTYDGAGYQIVALRGHLFELAEPSAQVRRDLEKRYSAWDLGALPWDIGDIAWKNVQRNDVGQVLSNLKAAAAGATEIVCATDVDPTGEGGRIFAEPLLELGITGKPMTRMYFTDEAPASIQKAFKARKPLPSVLTDFDEYKKSDLRSRFDWLSMQFTRIASLSAGQPVVLRQGRLKSAMVLLTGDQQEAHESYVKKPFFQNRFKDENGVVYIWEDEPKFATAAAVPTPYVSSAVVKDSAQMKRTAPPRLLDLAALSAKLSKQGIKAADVLKTYQRMYEDQVVSYPRTEDKTITHEQFDELAPLADKIAAVVGVDPAMLTVRTPRKTHVKDSGAHGANRPGPSVPDSLAGLEAKYGQIAVAIYTELARSYLAMLAADYEYEAQVGHVQAYPSFVGKTAVPKVRGWKDVFHLDTDDEDEDENTSVGLGTKASPFIYEGANPRPPKPTMTWLMKQLEKRDVGTGATRTSIYAEVTRPMPKTARAKTLITETKGVLKLTEHGQMSYRLLPGTHIGDLGTTETVYGWMRDVAAGKTAADDVLAEVATWVREDIAAMGANAITMMKELKLTPQVAAKEKFTGPWTGGDGQMVAFTREWSGHRFTDEECMALLAGDEITFEATSAKTGNLFRIHGRLAQQTMNGHVFVGFEAAKKADGTPDFLPMVDEAGAELPPAVWCKHKFTPDEIARLMAGGTIEASDFVSKKTGKKFSCKLTFTDEDGSGAKRLVPSFG